MGFLRQVKKFFTDPSPVSTLAQLETGRAIADGVVRAGESGTLTSPVRGQQCVAYYYTAFYLTGSRGGGMVPRKLRSAEVYTSFVLELEDGRVEAVPKKSDPFTGEDHRRLSGAGYEGFRATENLIPVGMRVRIKGRVRSEGDKLTIVYSEVEVLGPKTTEGGQSRKRRKKKQQKAQSRRG